MDGHLSLSNEDPCEKRAEACERAVLEQAKSKMENVGELQEMNLSSKVVEVKRLNTQGEEDQSKPYLQVQKISSFHARRKTRRFTWKREISLGLSLVLFISLVLVILQTQFLLRIQIENDSMSPRLGLHKQVYMQKITWLSAPLQRGDIVMLSGERMEKADLGYEYSVQRVIGLPYDQIEIQDRKIYVNGLALEEEYIAEDAQNYFLSNRYRSFTLGKDDYFTLLDNRSILADGRLFGPVQGEDIVAKLLY